MNPPPELLPIAVAVIVDKGRVLLVRRRVTEGSLRWQFPGGAIEAGETAEDAAVREVHEEVDLRVAATMTLGERVHPDTGRNVIYVACRPVSGMARLVDRDELAKIVWADAVMVGKRIPEPIFGPVHRYLAAALL